MNFAPVGHAARFSHFRNMPALQSIRANEEQEAHAPVSGAREWSFAAACALLVAASYGIVFLPISAAGSLLREDGPIEMATVVFFLVACLAFLRVWRLRGVSSVRREEGAGRRAVFGILAVLMFVCAGEEASWGQRVFGWQTPDGWSELNAQSETNLHNLAVIEGGVRDSKTRSLLRSLTNANRLFAIFWLTFFVLVPVLDRTLPAARSLFRAVGLPVPPLWIGGLFILNQVAFIVGNHHLEVIGSISNEAFPLDELKECNSALVYAAAGLAAFIGERARVSAPARQSRGA